MAIQDLWQALSSAKNVWVEFKNSKPVEVDSIWSRGEYLVSKTEDKIGRKQFELMKVPKPGNPVIHIGKSEQYGASIVGISVVKSDWTKKRQRQRYVIALHHYTPTGPIAEAVLDKYGNRILEEIVRDRPANFPFRRQRDGTLVLAQKYLTEASKSLVRLVLPMIATTLRNDVPFVERTQGDLRECVRIFCERLSKKGSTLPESKELIQDWPRSGGWRQSLALPSNILSNEWLWLRDISLNIWLDRRQGMQYTYYCGFVAAKREGISRLISACRDHPAIAIELHSENKRDWNFNREVGLWYLLRALTVHETMDPIRESSESEIAGNGVGIYQSIGEPDEQFVYRAADYADYVLKSLLARNLPNNKDLFDAASKAESGAAVVRSPSRNVYPRDPLIGEWARRRALV